MTKCIYCTKSTPEVSFLKREHVIPELFGTFENNLTLHGLVCDACNGDVFSPLEARFKEDTEEGIRFQQMYKLTGSTQVRIRNDKVKATFASGLGEKFFDEMFPFLDWQDGSWKVTLLPQVKVLHPSGGFWVLLVDRLKRLSAGKLKKIKRQLEGVKSKDVRIFVGGNSADDAPELDEAIRIVRELGIPYKEGERKFAPVEASSGQQFVVDMQCTVGSDYGRVIAKIAFNYFAYCALTAGRAEILFDKSFDVIRSYATGALELPVKDVIIGMDDKPIIWDEKQKGIRIVGHTVTFHAEEGRVLAKVSFMGRMIYTVLLGAVPSGVDASGLGCGHLFSPLERKIFQLTMDPRKWGSGIEVGFGLYCKD